MRKKDKEKLEQLVKEAVRKEHVEMNIKLKSEFGGK